MQIATYDLETTDLSGTFGTIICGCICPITTPDKINQPKTFRVDDTDAFAKDPLDDSEVCELLVEELGKYDMLVGWNSKLFDLPLLNARMTIHGLPPFFPHWHLDMMWHAAGNSTRMGSRKLDNVAKGLKTKTQKYNLMPEDWMRAKRGQVSAIDKVVRHCREDVKITSEVYWKLLPVVKNITRG